ncbi:MAG: aldo/keto reductase [Symploca sp. SIO2B6]|nr:aldo/keto reductase [Symploca sp. SIO2B6]
MAIAGIATPAGTLHYRERQGKECVPEHFREVNGLVASSIGVGTYLGKADAQTDALVTAAIVESVNKGINLIDTAINYRHQHGEHSVGQGILQLIESGTASREELIICTKGGFIPNRDRVNWFRQEYIENSSFQLTEADMVAQCHCMHPVYLRDQLERSLVNLGLEAVDIYYIHNPETQLSEVTPEVFYARLKAAFEFLETAVEAGKISAYGLATWSGFRVKPTEKSHLDLARIKAIAQSVASGDQSHFQFIQLPVNIAMLEALVLPTQNFEGQLIPAIEAAQRLGLTPIASAAIAQAKVLEKIPTQITSNLDSFLETNGQLALQFTRSAPGLLNALVGMKTPKYVTENLELTRVKPMTETNFQLLKSKLLALNFD